MRTPLFLLAALAFNTAQALACEATSGPTVPTVVELYTSEGCSSCPPADRWLSTLAGRSDVIALAFHVNYWDRLGWVDRFASPAATARQYELAQRSGQGGVYTPQVLVGGQDWRAWPQLPVPATVPGPGAGAPSPVSLQLDREGETVTARISPHKGAPARLAGYWAVLEDGYESHVRAGENAGETLRHNAVVRLYQPVAAWSAADPQDFALQVSHGAAEHPRRVVFVVTDPATGRPLQALALGC